MQNIKPDLMSKRFDDTLHGYRKKHNIKGLRKSVVHATKNFLNKHTNLSESDKDKIILKSILETAKSKKDSSYDGNDQFDNYEFGKNVRLTCEQNGIKIKKISDEAEEEIKESFSGTGIGVYKKAVEAVMDVLHLQPDLTTDDKEKILLMSLKKTIHESPRSYDGKAEFSYEEFGSNVKSNIDALRAKKKKYFFEVKDVPYPPMRGEGLDSFDNSEGGLEGFEEYEHDEDDYEDEDNFATLDTDDSFDGDTRFDSLSYDGSGSQDYEIVILEGEDADFDGEDDNYDNLFKKLKKKIQAKKTQIKAKVAKKKAKRKVNKAKRKENRKERGSVFGNILTGGVLGAAKKAKAAAKKKKEEKKKKKSEASKATQQAETGMNEAMPAQATLPAPVQDAGAIIAQQALPIPTPSPSDAGGGGGGSPSGGGGGGSPQDSEEDQGEDEPEEDEGSDQEEEDGEGEDSQEEGGEDESESEESEEEPAEEEAEEEVEEVDEPAQDIDTEESEREDLEYFSGPYYSFYEENKKTVMVAIVCIVAIVGVILWKKGIIKF